MSEALAGATEALQTTGRQADHAKVRIPQATPQEREAGRVPPGHHVLHGRQPVTRSPVVGGLQVPQHLPPLLWTQGPGCPPGCRLFRGGGKLLGETSTSTGLLVTGGSPLPLPLQQNGSHEEKDGNTNEYKGLHGEILSSCPMPRD